MRKLKLINMYIYVHIVYTVVVYNNAAIFDLPYRPREHAGPSILPSFPRKKIGKRDKLNFISP